MRGRLITLALAATIAGGAARADDIKIIYGSFSPPTSNNVAFGIVPFMDEVTKLTNGSVTFDLKAGGSLVDAGNALSGVTDGLVDGSFVPALYYPSELPINNVAMDLAPGISADTRAVAAAITEFTLLHCPECMQEYESWNLKYLGGYGVSAYDLLCSMPVQTMADLQGKRVRAAGAFGSQATALGMVPVNIPNTESYEGMQRGQLDCLMASPNFMDSYSFRDVAKNILRTKMGTAFSGPLLDVSLDVWGRLDDQQKDAMKRAAALGVATSATAYEADDAKVLGSAEATGISVVEPTDDVRAALDAYSTERRNVVIETAKGRGIENPEHLVDTFLSVLDKWTGIVDELDGDTQALTDRLYQEIYSKI